MKSDYSKVSSLYIHIPYCISKCQYCDFFSTTHLQNRCIPDSYVKALCNQIKNQLIHFNCHELSTIYIGGGTPSLLSKNQLLAIITAIKENAALSADCEFTMEANPDDITAEYLTFLKSTEINRLSVGLQSMNQACLNFSGRRANREQNLQALFLLSSHFPNFSVDFICGLPQETEETFLQGLKTAISYKPAHISMYSLTIEEKTPFGRLLSSGALDYNFDQADDLWLTARDFLEQNGYPQYEVSNFAPPAAQCRHNLVYWTHQSYLGCGSGATGTVYIDSTKAPLTNVADKKTSAAKKLTAAQDSKTTPLTAITSTAGTGLRWTNTTNIEEYIDFWLPSDTKKPDAASKTDAAHQPPATTEEIDLATSQFEFFMMGLRKLRGITQAEYKATFGTELPENFLNQAAAWQKKSLLEIEKEAQTTRYRLNKKGILFLNTFLEELL